MTVEQMERAKAVGVNPKDITVSPTSNPTPHRGWDFSAIDSNSYDVDFIGGEDGAWKGGPQGLGATEEEAIDNLLTELEERKDE
jgi:hypothetical protein